jgi:pyruvate-ferredoxin/flavodoxin oxidoreductase
VIRGTSQNPDVYFQGRETVNPYYAAVPGIIQRTMDRFAELTGRQYGLFEYVGAPDAERVILLMGSGIGAAQEAVEHLVDQGEKVGMIKIRLYRPFDAGALLSVHPGHRDAARGAGSLQGAGRRRRAPLQGRDHRTRPAFAEGRVATMPRVVGGRYGLSSKEFTPAMVKGVFDELAQPQAQETPSRSASSTTSPTPAWTGTRTSNRRRWKG